MPVFAYANGRFTHNMTQITSHCDVNIVNLRDLDYTLVFNENVSNRSSNHMQT